jgi:HEAT repeat protein
MEFQPVNVLALIPLRVLGFLVFYTVLVNAGDPERTGKLVGILRSDAGYFQKARACQQLGEVGTEEGVPILEELLNDPHLAAYARSGLENIPGPASARALRRALDTTQGAQLVGIVDSLGVLRDAEAVPALTRLAGEADAALSGASLRALGRIATRPAIAVLRRALASSTGPHRDEAAAGLLLAAERELQLGHRRLAQELYDAVCLAPVTLPLRVGATRGAILSRDKDPVGFMISQVRTKELSIRHAALMAARELKAKGVGRALGKSLATADRDLRIQLLEALVDRPDASTPDAVRRWVKDPDAEVQRAALRVMSRVAVPADAGLMLDVALSSALPDAATLALGVVTRMEGPEVDALILGRLSTAQTPAEKVALIRLLGDRGTAAAIPASLRCATDADPTVGKAAWGVLAGLAGRAELHELIRLAMTSATGTRDAAESAVASVIARMPDRAAGVDGLVAAHRGSRDSAERSAALRLLASVGGPAALDVLLKSLQDIDDRARQTALQSLAEWPDPGPVEALLALAASEELSARRSVALRGAIRMAGAAGEAPATIGQAAQWLVRAKEYVKTPEEKRLLISGFGQVRSVASFQALKGYVDDVEVATEAGFALLQMAPAIARTDAADSLRQVLDRVATSTPHQDLRQKARKFLEGMVRQ